MADNNLPEGFSLDQAPDTSSPSENVPQGFQLDEEKFGSVGQQVLTGVEGLAKGVAGPVATGAEALLSKAGVPGLSPSEQEGRAEANPWIHGGSEAVGLIGPAVASVGLSAAARAGLEVPELASAGAKALAKYSQSGAMHAIGEGALGLSGLEGASTISKIASAGIKTGAEMAALQAGDEVSKAINQDPSQSIGTAAVNIGLSGILGGAGGAILGSVSPLWKSSMEKMGAPKLLDDAKAQYNFRQSIPAGDIPAAVTDELNTRLNEVDNLRSQVSRLKGDGISKAIPEMNDKIETQVRETIESISSKIEAMKQDPSSYPARLVNKLEQNLENFKNKAFVSGSFTPPAEESGRDYFEKIPKSVLKAPKPSPERITQIAAASNEAQAGAVSNLESANKAGFNPYDLTPKTELAHPLDVFNAMQDLKSDLQDYSKGNYGPFAIPKHNEAYDFLHSSKDLARDVRLGLEDSKVWGDAGDIQRKTNAAIKASIDAEKDAASKFSQKSAVEGGRVADPAKVQTLVNQSLKGKAGLKGDFIGNYIKYTDDLADTINKIHTDLGLDAPVRLTPAPATNHVLGAPPTAGTRLGNWFYDKGLATVAGHVAGEGIGASLGALVGHPALGALAGERMLAPALTSIAKPLMESASRSEAMKASLDYVTHVIKGENILSKATKNIFKGEGELLSKDLIPDGASRERLQKSLDYASNIDNSVKIGGEINHYLPDHGVAAAATAATAIQYLNSLKPTQPKSSPLDKPAPIDKGKQQVYNRQLDIAQQPLLVLKYAKEGVLQAQDVKTLSTLYPSLQKKIVSKIYDEMTKSISEGHQIPYKQRQSLSLLMGQTLDSTMTQPTMATVMMANAPKGQPQAPQKKVSKATASSMEKSSKMYATPAQRRESGRS